MTSLPGYNAIRWKTIRIFSCSIHALHSIVSTTFQVFCRAVACYGSTLLQRNSIRKQRTFPQFGLCAPFHRCKIFWGLCMIPFYGFTDYGHFWMNWVLYGWIVLPFRQTGIDCFSPQNKFCGYENSAFQAGKIPHATVR